MSNMIYIMSKIIYIELVKSALFRVSVLYTYTYMHIYIYIYICIHTQHTHTHTMLLYVNPKIPGP